MSKKYNKPVPTTVTEIKEIGLSQQEADDLSAAHAWALDNPGKFYGVRVINRTGSTYIVGRWDGVSVAQMLKRSVDRSVDRIWIDGTAV